MNFEQNVALLKFYLKQHGWEYLKSDHLYEYYISSNTIKLNIPLVHNDSQFPEIFEISLKRIKMQSPTIANLPVFKVLLAQCKNMRQKYSIKKDEWILSEPNSKYNLNEIPDIYIPKNNIFETKE